MGKIRVAAGVSKRNADGSITLPARPLSDKSPRWGPWRDLPKPARRRAA
jgi:hypothetical protein